MTFFIGSLLENFSYPGTRSHHVVFFAGWVKSRDWFPEIGSMNETLRQKESCLCWTAERSFFQNHWCMNLQRIEHSAILTSVRQALETLRRGCNILRGEAGSCPSDLLAK